MRTSRIDSEPTGAGAGVNGAAACARQTAAPRVGAAALTCDFALALERRRRGTAVLVLAGELDLYRAPDVERALAEAIGLKLDKGRRQSIPDGQPADGGEIAAEKVRQLAVDLRSVTFIDSTTLALLLAASRHQQARGGDLLVLVGPQTPMTAFQVTGFDRLLTIRRGDDHPRDNDVWAEAIVRPNRAGERTRSTQC
jgi:anti-anti-sigma regulatory factor